MPSMEFTRIRPPPREEAFTTTVRPRSPMRVMTAVLGWASRRSTVWMRTSIRASRASWRLRGMPGSSGFMASSPATMALSVPWPAPVAAKEPWRAMLARAGWKPSSFRPT